MKNILKYELSSRGKQLYVGNHWIAENCILAKTLEAKNEALRVENACFKEILGLNAKNSSRVQKHGTHLGKIV